MNLPLWCSPNEVTSGFIANQVRGSAKSTQFNIVGFYLLISKELLIKALSTNKGFPDINDSDIGIVHSRKMMLFKKDLAWVK